MNLMPTKKPKTVDQVMGVFHKTIADLEEVSTSADAAVEDLNLKKRDLEIEIETAAMEGQRARKIRDQLRAVVQG